VAWEEYRFEIVDMDGNRIDRLLVTHVPASAEPVDSDEMQDNSTS
jgi:CBS domain containing-hemolysin-like protein